MMRLDKTLSGIKDEKTPIWFMRQAGRHLPEYRALRKTEPDFIKYCLNSEKAAQATLQPIQRYDIDAAIVFSDILMIPWALDRGVRFVEGEGPKLNPLQSIDDVRRFMDINTNTELSSIFKTVERTRSNLASESNLIGFCGAPWTVATYMIEGGSSRNFKNTLKWLYDKPDAMALLFDKLIAETITYLASKVEAGADTLMIFDSWAGAVPDDFFEDIVIEPTCRIIDGLRAKGITAPIIGFPKGIGEQITRYAENVAISAIAIDHGIDALWANANLPDGMPVQGNLDPMLLLEGGEAMLRATDKILDAFCDRPHIFNLGHGIDPKTPTENVDLLIKHIRGTALNA